MAGKKQKKIKVEDLDNKALIALNSRLEKVLTIKGNACEGFYAKVQYELRFRNLALLKR